MNIQLCRTLAAYNIWMNARLYDVVAGIPDEARKRDLGAFFGSLHGTLNHIMVADIAWLARFQAKPVPPNRLNAILHQDFQHLAEARKSLDGEITAYIEGLTPKRLAETLDYMSLSYGPQSRPLWLLVMHVFNHQTHHRGQATTLIKQLGYDPGITDLPAMPGAGA